MALGVYQNSVFNSDGTPAKSISIIVTDSVTGDPAVIYADEDGGTPLTSLQTDTLGYFKFAAAGGFYDITFGVGDDAPTWTRVAIGTFQAEDYDRGWRDAVVEEGLDEAIQGLEDADAKSFLRADTSTNWAATDPVIPENEAIFVTDLDQIRVGDGTSQYSGLTPIGGGSGTLTTVSDTLTSAITTARLLEATDAVFAVDGTTARVRRLQVNLSSPGRFDIDKTLAANARIVLEILATSEIPTFGIEDDEAGSSIAEGKSAAATISAQPGSTVEFTVLSNAGSAPVCRAVGNFIDEARTIPAPLTVTGDITAPTTVVLEVFGPGEDVATGDGAAYFPIPPELDGYDLTAVWGRVITAATGSGSETITVQVHNATQAADMLSTRLTIDEDEASSATAAAAAVIDTANDDVADFDLLRIDVDAVPSTTPGTGLYVGLKFAKP